MISAAAIPVAAQPTPRQIDISCGQCLLFHAADQSAILDILNRKKVQWSRLFRRDAQDGSYQQLAIFADGIFCRRMDRGKRSD